MHDVIWHGMTWYHTPWYYITWHAITYLHCTIEWIPQEKSSCSGKLPWGTFFWTTWEKPCSSKNLLLCPMECSPYWVSYCVILISTFSYLLSLSQTLSSLFSFTLSYILGKLLCHSHFYLFLPTLSLTNTLLIILLYSILLSTTSSYSFVFHSLTHIRIHTHTYTHTYTHSLIHTHIHTQTHTRTS